MANLKGQIKVKLGSKEYTARLTIEAIMGIENALNMGIVKLATNMSEGDVRLSQIISVLHPALRGGGNDLNSQQVVKIVSDCGIVNATQAVASILTETLTQSSEDNAEKKPEAEQE